MKPDIYYCHKCKRSHGQGECGKRNSGAEVARKPCDESARVENVTGARPVARPTIPTQSDIDALLKAYRAKEEHKRKLKREQMQRYRARGK